MAPALAPHPVDVGGGPLHVVSALGSFDRGRSFPDDPVHALVRRFRGGEPAAVDAVVAAARTAIERDSRLRSPSIAGVLVPGHDGADHPGLITLLAALSEGGGWTPATGRVLVRRTPAAEAKLGGTRDPALEAESLEAAPSRLRPAVRTIVLVDDVLATGGTVAACVAALRRDGWRGDVAALVVAVARSEDA